MWILFDETEKLKLVNFQYKGTVNHAVGNKEHTMRVTLITCIIRCMIRNRDLSREAYRLKICVPVMRLSLVNRLITIFIPSYRKITPFIKCQNGPVEEMSICQLSYRSLTFFFLKTGQYQ